jgi:VanZ family protein
MAMVATSRYVARTLFIVGVIAVAWSLAASDAMPEVDIWDKLGHFLAYASLALCGCLAFSIGRAQVVVGVSLVAYGCVLEIGQTFIPGRSGSIQDAIANALGVMFAIVLVRVMRWYFVKGVESA